MPGDEQPTSFGVDIPHGARAELTATELDMPDICYDHEIFAAQKTGGVSRYFTQLIGHLPVDPHSIRVFAGFYINMYLKGAPSVCGLRSPAIPRTTRLRQHLSALWLQAYLRASPYRLLHKTWYSRQDIPRNTKVVITVHDMIPELHPDLFRLDLRLARKREAVSGTKRYWCRRADAILAVSETTKRDLVRIFGIPPERIVVTPLASSLDTSIGSGPSHCPRPFLLYVGMRNAYKNHVALFTAFSRSKQLKESFDLVFFGGAPLSAAEHVGLQRLGIANRVRWTCGSDADLLRYYRHATALVYPSLYEGFGLPVVEAMSAGCPVICSDTPVFREVAGDGAIYFDPLQVESLASVLERFVGDAEQCLAFAEKGRSRSLLFSWSKCANQTAEVYQSLQ